MFSWGTPLVPAFVSILIWLYSRYCVVKITSKKELCHMDEYLVSLTKVGTLMAIFLIWLMYGIAMTIYHFIITGV